MDAIRRVLGSYRYAAIALVTVLTLGIIGAVVVTTTSLGCGPANKLGVKTTRCIQAGPVAHVGSPTPRGASPTSIAQPTAQPTVENSPSPPPLPAPTADAAPNAPYNPGASNSPPYQNVASAAAPPLAYPASGSLAGVFSCQLPVYAGGPGSGGFVVFPGQTFVADPRSAVTVPTPNPPPPSPPPAVGPGGPAGWYGETYDARFAKWLPVPYAWVSPDGTHYAYPLGGHIYLEDVANGSLVDLGTGHGTSPIDTENNGVYATSPGQPGLWFVPFSGAAQQVTASGFWQAVGYGAAYGTPTSAVPFGAESTIERLDLKTGTIAPFFSDPGGQGQVTGFDPLGNPVIQVSYRSATAIFIATGPSTSVAIATSIPAENWYQPAPFPYGAPIADSHGLWFSAGNGIVLYRNLGWYWMASIGGQIAGKCI